MQICCVQMVKSPNWLYSGFPGKYTKLFAKIKNNKPPMNLFYGAQGKISIV